jgi:RNA 2',3'-cyclic 3'-phosphodiesterase
MRLFTGISLDPIVEKKLAHVLNQLRPSAELKWSPVGNLHITTKFIGEWPEMKLADLQNSLGAMPSTGPIDITVSRFGFLPNPHHPHAFFAGVQAGPELSKLANRIDETVVALGGKKEDRPYLPHVTLARIRNQRIQGLREQIASMTDFNFGTFQATEFHLYVSEAGVYAKLSSYRLERTA